MYKKNDVCLVCESTIDIQYLDLTDQPLANSYHKGEKLEKYPLQMLVCDNCWHSQLSVSVEPSEMFEHYLYVSDTSKTLTDYFEWCTEYMLKNVLEQPKNVLEIACNSGLLLEMFKKRDLVCVGVDPAANLRELSQQRELDVYVDYWNQSFSEKVKEERGQFDLVLAFHVLPHVESPNDFIRSCVNVLSDNGTIFIQTSQCDMFLNNEFDVIYHEHSSYFTARSIKELAHRNNLFVSSIIKTDIHSKSFLFSLTKVPCEETQLNALIEQEENDNIYSITKYFDFAAHAEYTRLTLTQNLDKFKAEGYTLVGYGAAAKGNTLLNYMQYKLDYIIDDNPLKHGYLTPGMDIPITSIDLIADNKIEKVCFVPLAWNFYKEIKERIAKVRDTTNDKFIKYFPEYSEE
jgi:2-polyprenyl-3-methyl-5-hydroxy-6-metoxy-1,4-benzoquinol methylase